jgi:hypothetical protein
MVSFPKESVAASHNANTSTSIAVSFLDFNPKTEVGREADIPVCPTSVFGLNGPVDAFVGCGNRPHANLRQNPARARRCQEFVSAAARLREAINR